MITLESANIKLESAGITPSLKSKWDALIAGLSGYTSAVVAYSGGVDSSFLAYATALVLGEKMVAVTAASTLEALDVLQTATEFVVQHGINHTAIPYDPMQNPVFSANPVERCYHCKINILGDLWQFARSHAYQVVLEGQNADDLKDYRPGSKAVLETGTQSPLSRHGLTKAEIRWLSKVLGLSVWDKPSAPCLATRIPYGMPITASALSQIDRAETFLHMQGFKVVRVRYHNELARVEIDPEQMPRFLELRQTIVEYFKQIGFLYVALDLQGYRLGSMNEGLSL